MILSALAGNTRIKDQLAHREREFAHAYLLAGPAGSGRHTLAALLATAMVCTAPPQERPCGICPACRKAAGGFHPDVSVVAGADGKPITVDQIRALRSDAYVRANEAKRKVYVLERADHMNASAQNAMLKLLEDGPSYAVFLLLVENSAALLPTVRSRCETLTLSPVAPQEALQWLEQRFPDRPESERSRAAQECQGILGQAVKRLESGFENSALAQLALELAAVLEGEDELSLFETAMGLEKLGREELTAALDTTLVEVGRRLVHSEQKRRLLMAADLLRTLREGAQLNANPGQLAGWLCAGMFAGQKPAGMETPKTPIRR